MSFENLNLIKPIYTALIKKGYNTPTPIQQKAIPVILEGREVLGSAQTGTGKTAAFAIPILQKLYETKGDKNSRRKIRSLILSPTRELAVQIGESFKDYGLFTGLKKTVVYGGVSQRPQTERIKEGVDILIATPGRLLDLMNQGYIRLDSVEIFVLDEADRMLDMGFITDIKKIIARLPEKKQTLFFSATMPPKIVELADELLENPVRIDIRPEKANVDKIDQRVYFVAKDSKRDLLRDILSEAEVSSALIFTRTKYGAEKLSDYLNRMDHRSEALHSDKSQNQRQKALNNFKSGKTKILVATDIVSRGIDVDQLSHVINFEIPMESETYVHRIGRTGRAGATGIALSFCDSEERKLLKNISRLIKRDIPVISDHPYISNNGGIVRESFLTDDEMKGDKKKSGGRNRRSQGNGKHKSPVHKEMRPRKSRGGRANENSSSESGEFFSKGGRNARRRSR
ncbi:MAG: DEAD/DEAH box helicase [Ignavibacteriaceae bacterium]|nr:DEAD/DEAH box helicase [Ignavibacteriaceae bacterium]